MSPEGTKLEYLTLVKLLVAVESQSYYSEDTANIFGSVMKRSETRRRERVPSGASVKLRWNEASGGLHFARGKILNASSTGLCIELVEPIKPLSFVSLDAPELNRADLAAGGSIRHCIQKGSKYVVGVELKTGAKWN